MMCVGVVLFVKQKTAYEKSISDWSSDVCSSDLGYDCKPVAGELTYGLERLAMYIQGVDSFYDLAFNDVGVTYGDVFKQNEFQFSEYNFEVSTTERRERKECVRTCRSRWSPHHSQNNNNTYYDANTTKR